MLVGKLISDDLLVNNLMSEIKSLTEIVRLSHLDLPFTDIRDSQKEI